jgi:Flp pilus assembly protein TadG
MSDQDISSPMTVSPVTSSPVTAAPNRAARRLAGALTRRFRREEKGVAAIEFGFIAMTMVVMLTGIVDISNSVSMSWRVSTLNRTLADLSSQATQINNTEIANIFAASTAVLSPYSGPLPSMSIVSVVVDPAGVAKVCWSEGRNGGAAPARGSNFVIPTDLRIANTSLIVASSTLIHDPIIWPNNITLNSKPLYFRPRLGARGGPNNVEQVERTGVALC